MHPKPSVLPLPNPILHLGTTLRSCEMCKMRSKYREINVKRAEPMKEGTITPLRYTSPAHTWRRTVAQEPPSNVSNLHAHVGEEETPFFTKTMETQV